MRKEMQYCIGFLRVFMGFTFFGNNQFMRCDWNEVWGQDFPFLPQSTTNPKPFLHQSSIIFDTSAIGPPQRGARVLASHNNTPGAIVIIRGVGGGRSLQY